MTFWYTVFTVFVDNTEVVTCCSIVAAITSCFLCYWLFDIKYAKNFAAQLSYT